jgi:hypothetical protein
MTIENETHLVFGGLSFWIGHDPVDEVLWIAPPM